LRFRFIPKFLTFVSHANIGGIMHGTHFDLLLSDIAETAAHLWSRGWAEAHAGNISARCEPSPDELLPTAVEHPAFPLPFPCPHLAGAHLLVTGSGMRMRDVAGNPTSGMGLVSIDASGAHAVFKLYADARHRGMQPTSELPTHLAIHEAMAAAKLRDRVVVHTHVAELIAMTHDPRFSSSDALAAALQAMLPEALLYLPEGVGVVPYLRTGSEALGAASAEALLIHRVILWEKHGVVARGETAALAFDAIDIAAKAASIHLLCRQAGYEPSGISRDQLAELRGMLS
jgi:rhamnulose-1-phosphate aldolase